MAVSSARIDEMIAKFSELEDEAFEEWMAKQPDFEELATILLDLFRTNPKTESKPDAAETT